MLPKRDAPSPTSSAPLLGVAGLILSLTATLCLSLRAVPKQELCTITAACFYVLFATSIQPSNSTRKQSRPLARQISRWVVRGLLFTSFLLSIAIPWLWIAKGVDEQRLKLLAPHLFAMMAQVLFEIWSYAVGVGPTIRIAIPVGFVAYRMRLLIAWTNAAWDLEDREMIALAATNLTFWAFILFYVLLIRVCPLYFRQRPAAQPVS